MKKAASAAPQSDLYSGSDPAPSARPSSSEWRAEENELSNSWDDDVGLNPEHTGSGGAERVCAADNSRNGAKEALSRDTSDGTVRNGTLDSPAADASQIPEAATVTFSSVPTPTPVRRFRRPAGWTPEATRSERKASFWSGVKPARANSRTVTTARVAGMSVVTMATLRAAIKLKKKANVIQAKSVLTKHLLDPRTPFMRYWKNWMVVNIMYTVLVVPWRISFELDPDVAQGEFGVTLSTIANVSFVVDTILHFFTAVETEGGMVTDRQEIARRYLTSWFVIDIVSCIPFTTLLRDHVYASVRVLTPMRSLRLLGLLKVVKVYAMHYEVSPVAMSIGKTLVTVILAAHLLSCLWFWVSCFDSFKPGGDPKPWNQCGSTTSSASQYLSSFYFIIYTMMTVGYGDQHSDPTSRKGLILSVAIQLTGATLFGFIIAATRRIVQFIAPIQKATTTNLQKVSEYAVDRRLPDGVSSRIKRHFRYFYFKTSVFDERAVMREVPWQMCREVATTTHGVALGATGLLQEHDFSPIVLMRLAGAMKPMELDSNEEPLQQGDVVLQVYFVIRGRIEAYIHEGKVTSDLNSGVSTAGMHGPGLRSASYMGVWGPGSLWGLSNVLLGGLSEATFVAASPSDLMWLDQADLIAALEEHPTVRPAIEKTAERAREALTEAVASETITKEGLKLKQISLTDFKPSDLKQQLKHTDVHSLCMAASTDKALAAHPRRGFSATTGAAPGGMAGMVQDFQQMAAFGGRGMKGRVKNMLISIKGAFGGRTTGRTQMRLVRTWRGGNQGFGDVRDGMGRVVDGVMETEETPDELNRRLIVLPDQPAKLRWDVGISMVCVLVAVLTPYRMAFALSDSKSWLSFDATVDVFFVIDILLRFRTAYVGSGANNVIVYITIQGMIVRNYLRGWMILDIASTVPTYLFGSSDQVFRALFVLKLLRVGRVPALVEHLHRLSEQEAISSGGPRRKGWIRGMQVDVPRWCLDVAQILIVILYASHIFGCLWWVTSRYDDENSWWTLDNLDINDTTSTYIASLYWAATTITTVGYGDLTPTNDVERAVACLTMVCGTTMFSYVIGSVSTLVMNPTEGHVRRNLELMNVENYLEEQKVGGHLSNIVRAHMVFVMGARSAWNEDHILSNLPPNIRERVLHHVHRDAVDVIPIFKAKPPGFVAAILRNLRPHHYPQGEIVYKNLEMSQGVYFVTKGIAEAYVKAGESGGVEGIWETEEKVKGIASPGKIFGYTRFLASFLDDDLAVRAFTQLHVYLLSNSSIRHMLNYNPDLAKELRVGLEQVVFEQASAEITTEQKKRAAREALYGQRKDKPVPASKTEAARTSVLTSYLRRESIMPSNSPVNSRLRIDKGKTRQKKSTASKVAKNMSPFGGRKLGSVRRWSFRKETEGMEFSDSSDSSSDEPDSLTMPGLTGVLVSQLTCERQGLNGDAAVPEAQGAAAGGREHPLLVAAAAAVANAMREDSDERLPQQEGDREPETLPTASASEERLAPFRHISSSATSSIVDQKDSGRLPPPTACLEDRDKTQVGNRDED